MLICFTLFQISCSKDDFTPDLAASDWSPELAFPLADSEISMSDLAHVNDTSTTMVVDDDKFCTLIYRGDVFDLSASQLVTVPDQGHQSQFSLNNSEILTYNNTGQVSVSQSHNLIFNVSQGIELDSMILKNTEMILNINSDFPADATVQVTCPSLLKEGNAFVQTIQMNYSGGPSFAMASFPLNDYHADLTNNGTSHNTLTVNYTITFNGNNGPVSSSNAMSINMVLQNPEYKVLYGYLGQQNLSNIPDTVTLSIFNNAVGTGSFTVAEPSIHFDISNSLGIPFAARISQLTAVSQTSFTVASGIPDPLPVSSPTIAQQGQTLTGSFTMDNTNSNVTSMISDQPKYLTVQSHVNTNPAGRTINFITDSSHLAVKMIVELPLYGTASNFVIRDTVPFNYNDLENVESLKLRLNIENWVPLDAAIQLVFTDESNTPLDTLFFPGEVVVPSGIVSGTGERVTISGKKITDMVFDQQRISRILGAKKIEIIATANTYQQGSVNVKIYNDYRLKVKIGAIAKLKIN
jgi:hypothetical protein